MPDPDPATPSGSPPTHATPDGAPPAAGDRPPWRVSLATAEGIPPTLIAWSSVTWRVLVVLAGLWVLFQALGFVGAVVMALFFALLMTALAGPIARLLERVLPTVVSVVLSLLAIAVATVVVIALVVRSIINEAPALAASVSDAIQQLEDWLQTGPLQLSDADLQQAITQAEEWGKQVGTTLLGDLGGVFSSLGTLVTAGSVFLFAVLFFMIRPEPLWEWLMGWIPASARDSVDVSGRIAWDSISGYTRGIVVVALADAVLVYIGLVILQVPLAPALAAVVFIGAFIPVIGAPIATFFAAIVALAERGIVVALLVVALTVVVGSFDGDVMQPLVMGKAVSLHPLAIVILIAGGALGFGVIGALIAVPLGSAVYGVLKYLSGRDPDHPRPGGYEAPPPGAALPAEPAPVPGGRLRRLFRRHRAAQPPRSGPADTRPSAP